MKLSPREEQVLARICAGRSYKEIASLLGIMPATVGTHAARIKDKMQARTIGQAVYNYCKK